MSESSKDAVGAEKYCLSQRDAAIARVNTPLPGSEPYDNQRPLRVPGRYAGWSLLAFLCDYHPHFCEAYWKGVAADGQILLRGERVQESLVVKPGMELIVVERDTVEPPVATAVHVLYEDDHLMAVNKPAPLPVHPCGRFNRNTLVGFLAAAFPDLRLKPVHRLDADTTGVVLLAKNRLAARRLSEQFGSLTAEKRYLAQVVGYVAETIFERNDPISIQAGALGGRTIAPKGKAARTVFETLRREPDYSVVIAFPKQGRTNQIRLHLAAAGHPVVQDVVYGLRGPSAGHFSDTTGDGGSLRLHALEIKFRHPMIDELIGIVAPPPEWAGTILAGAGGIRGLDLAMHNNAVDVAKGIGGNYRP